ncbi:hypothetical protein TNCT_134611, partial [Trichonephila clavata]
LWKTRSAVVSATAKWVFNLGGPAKACVPECSLI